MTERETLIISHLDDSDLYTSFRKHIFLVFVGAKTFFENDLSAILYQVSVFYELVIKLLRIALVCPLHQGKLKFTTGETRPETKLQQAGIFSRLNLSLFLNKVRPVD